MKKIRNAVLVTILAAFLAVGAAAAQDQTLTLGLSRDFGYGGFNGDIQGLFTMHITGPANLARVDFYIDETKIGEVNQAPFNLQFKTDLYPVGMHSLYAIGFTTDGQQLRSPSISREFISASASSKNALTLIVPILVIVFGATILSALFPTLTGRGRKKGQPGMAQDYRFGGGICPKCGHPVALPALGVHLMASKLARCPNCGKWSMIRPVSVDKLRAAEAAEQAGSAPQVPGMTEDDKIKKELDDSKYQGL
jgi:DNA-directed RNA polymerase subunit RPC12/RpoP